MDVLILGYSKIVKKRVLPALEKIDLINSVDIASITGHAAISHNGKIRSVYKDYDQALLESKSQLVYISTVNSDHVFWVAKSLEKGFHVMVDKPAVLNLTDAESVVSLARSRGLFLSEALVYQYHPQFNTIKKLFQDYDDFPRSITANFSVPGFEDENFRYDLKKGGGAIYDMAPYALSIGKLFFDKDVIDIKAFELTHQQKGVETAFSLMARYDSGKAMIGYFGFDTEYINRCSILGKYLSVDFDRVFTTEPDGVNIISYKYKNHLHSLESPIGDSFELYILNCLNSIQAGDIESHAYSLLQRSTLISQLQKNIKR